MTHQTTRSRKAATSPAEDAQAKLYRAIGIPAVAAAASLVKPRRNADQARPRETPFILRVEALD